MEEALTAPKPEEGIVADVSESVKQILELEAKRPQLIQRLLEGRKAKKTAADEAVAKIKATAAEQDEAILRSLRALGWRRSRVPKATTGAPKPPKNTPRKKAKRETQTAA